MAEGFTSNAAEVAGHLHAMAERVGDPTPALERVRQTLADQESEVWSSQGASLGLRWPASADPERKVDPQLLVASGALRASLTGSGAGRVHGTELEFGTDVAYALFHQYGTSRMPARPFMGISPETARVITDRLNEAIAEDLA